MADDPSSGTADNRVETPEVVDPPRDPAERDDRGMIEEPAKIMRIGSMIKQMLEELRNTDLDTPARSRFRDIYEQSLVELGTSLSPELCDELNRLTTDFDDGEPPSKAELRMAKAQLVGWLEGLFQGIQATLISQQMAARQQLDRMQHQLPSGTAGGPERPGGSNATAPGDRPGTYL